MRCKKGNSMNNSPDFLGLKRFCIGALVALSVSACTSQSVPRSNPSVGSEVPTAQSGTRSANWSEVWASLDPKDAVRLCDEVASHPADPLKPRGVSGVASDADINVEAGMVYCHKALQARIDSPRIGFQWTRVNMAKGLREGGSWVDFAHHGFGNAYKRGSEIAGIYLAKLPPRPTFEQGIDLFIKRRDEYRRRVGSGAPPVRIPAEQLLAGSLIAISSIAIVKSVLGDPRSTEGSQLNHRSCPGGLQLDPATLSLICNGLIVGQW